MKSQNNNIILSIYKIIERIIREIILKIRYGGGLTYEAPYYWILTKNDRKGPYCQRCREVESRLLTLERRSDGILFCHQCKSEYEDPSYEPPELELID